MAPRQVGPLSRTKGIDRFLALKVHCADGGYVAGNYRGKQFEHPTTGTVGLQICGHSEDPGTFTLTGRLQNGLTHSNRSRRPSQGGW